MPNTAEAKLTDLVLSLTDRLVPYKLSFSKPCEGAPISMKAQLCEKDGAPLLVIEEKHEYGRVAHTNLATDLIADKLRELIASYMQINVTVDGISAEYKRSKKGSSVLIGADKLAKISGTAGSLGTLQHKKEYLLAGDELFLHKLGISDASGRVHDKKQAKYRQINHFLQHLENIYSALPEQGALTVYDLCCGKSYLSFAVYRYLTSVKGRKVSMLCIDRRNEVIDYCADIASSCGFDGMSFVCDDVRNTPKGVVPDLVISLHACDIATDIVLNCAISLGARAVMSTPCCHRYLNDRIKSRELSFVHSIPQLRGKLCEALTDAIRVARLKMNGYSVNVMELTDPENTPKNTLICAKKIESFNKDGARAQKLKKEYSEILSFVLGDGADKYLSELD